jgi:hypothetical protein
MIRFMSGRPEGVIEPKRRHHDFSQMHASCTREASAEQDQATQGSIGKDADFRTA